MKVKLAQWMRTMADRLDHPGAPKYVGYSFTFEKGMGLVFRQRGDFKGGCPLMYFGDEDYKKAWQDSLTYKDLY